VATIIFLLTAIGALSIWRLKVRNKNLKQECGDYSNSYRKNESTKRLMIPNSITIGTYNAGLIELQLFGKTVFTFAPHVAQRSLALPNLLKNSGCDVICLQEVFDRSHAEYLQSELMSVYPYQYFPRTYRPKIFDTGLAFLSKYPLQNTEVNFFSDQLLEEKIFAPKGYITARFIAPQFGAVSIVNCHTTAGGSKHHPESSITDSCRQNQLAELAKVSEDSAKYGDVAMIAGDLNCGPEASFENFNALINEGYSDAVAKWYLGKGTAPVTWDPNNPLNVNSPHKTSPPQRIDHILIANSSPKIDVIDVTKIGADATIQVKSSAMITVSDHYGFVVTLSLKAA
jgi:endonuclease/exonuclease/phosphatase family metal-dependent hydrolase